MTISTLSERATLPETAILSSRGKTRSFRYRFLHNLTALASAVVLLMVVLVAVFQPAIAPFDPTKQHLLARLLPPAWDVRGNPAYLLGTDQLGRDELSRIMSGARVSLLVGFVTVGFSAILGVALGLASGYFGGLTDRLIMRLTNIQLAMPRILLAISMIAVMGPSVQSVILALSIGGWPYYSRIVRAQVLSLREKEFVEAAQCLGVPSHQIILRHIFPHTLPSVIIIATTSVATNIILESSLSFLGLGVGADTITWGTMLSDSRSYISTSGWLSTLPGFAIMITVLVVNMLGDWLRDELDPRIQTGQA